MRIKILIAVGVILLLLAGGLVAYLLFRSPPQGELDTQLKGVSLVTPTTAGARPKPGRKPRVPVKADRVCWTMFGGDPNRSLARPEIHLGIPLRPPIWARGLHGYIEYPPVYCDGVLYVNTYRGDTWAIEARSGKVLWTRYDSAHKPSSPAIAGADLLISGKDGTETALNRANGHVVWQLRVGSVIESSPAVQDGVAYFGSQDGRLFAVDAQSGRIRWAYNTGGEINASPTLVGDRVCITNYSGAIFCLRARDGTKVWSTYVKRDPIRYESFYASASSDGVRLYTIARSGKVIALSARTGQILWTRGVNTLGYSTPAVDRHYVYVGDFNGTLHAFRKTTGEQVWETRVPGGVGRILGAPVVIGGLVFFATLETNVYAARVADGRIVWQFPIGKYSPGIATERAYYFSLNGILVSMRGQYSPK